MFFQASIAFIQQDDNLFYRVLPPSQSMTMDSQVPGEGRKTFQSHVEPIVSTLPTDDVHKHPDIEINPVQVHTESAALETFFQVGLRGGQEAESDNEDDEMESRASEEEHDNVRIVDNLKTHDALAWVDEFILTTRRKSGRQTENSVLKLWKVSSKKSP